MGGSRPPIASFIFDLPHIAIRMMLATQNPHWFWSFCSEYMVNMMYIYVLQRWYSESNVFIFGCANLTSTESKDEMNTCPKNSEIAHAIGQGLGNHKPDRVEI